MAKLPNISELNKCPYCGCDEYIEYFTVSGKTHFRYRFDGKDSCNEDMHNGMRQIPQKFIYCACCDKKIARND